jgi:hypothetical protein
MKFLRAFLLGFVAFGLSAHASVLLGLVGIEPDVPIPGEEDVVIYNLTGPTFGCSTGNGTPICTAVTFDNVILTINGGPLDVGDVGPGSSDTFALAGGTFNDGSITSLSLSATLSTTFLSDDLGNHYNVSLELFLNGIATDGSLPEIAAAPALTGVPEPSPLVFLCGLCLAGGRRVFRGR